MKNFFVSFLFSAFSFGFTIFFGAGSSLTPAVSAIDAVQDNGGQSVSEYKVRLNLNKRHYKGGDKIEGKVIAEKNGYLYLFDYGTDQEFDLFYPNEFTEKGENNVKKGETEIPVISVRPPYGKETLIAYLSEKEFNINSGKEKEQLIAEVKKIVPHPCETPHHNGKIQGNRAVDMVEVTTVPDPSERFLCCIGIDCYRDSGYPKLHCCENDAVDIEMLFKEKCCVNENNCYRLINSDAAYEKVKNLFCTILPKETEPGSTIFVYWSGHGDRVPDRFNKKKYRSCFILPDTKSNNLEDTALLESEFGNWIQNLQGRKIVFILDTCYSGGFAEGVKSIGGQEAAPEFLEFDFEPENKSKAISLEGNAIISACGAKEKARSGMYNSLMTGHIIEILENLEEDEALTPAELIDRIQPQIEKDGAEAGYIQHIQVKGTLQETILINTP